MDSLILLEFVRLWGRNREKSLNFLEIFVKNPLNYLQKLKIIKNWEVSETKLRANHKGALQEVFFIFIQRLHYGEGVFQISLQIHCNASNADDLWFQRHRLAMDVINVDFQERQQKNIQSERFNRNWDLFK